MCTATDRERELFRESVREFVKREIQPHVLDWEEVGAVLLEVWIPTESVQHIKTGHTSHFQERQWRHRLLLER